MNLRTCEPVNLQLGPDGYLLGSYRIATAPEPNSSRLTSFESIGFIPRRQLPKR